MDGEVIMAGETKKHNKMALRLPFGLCKRYGIMLPKNATPRQAWDALRRGTGQTPKDVFAGLNKRKPKPLTKEKQAEIDKKKIEDRIMLFVKHGERSGWQYKIYSKDWEKNGQSRTYYSVFETSTTSKHNKRYDFGYYDNNTNEFVPNGIGLSTGPYGIDLDKIYGPPDVKINQRPQTVRR